VGSSRNAGSSESYFRIEFVQWSHPAVSRFHGGRKVFFFFLFFFFLFTFVILLLLFYSLVRV
jgi:hypothetical protein